MIDTVDSEPLHLTRRYLFSFRFPAAAEAEFRREYRGQFRLYTQIIWWSSTLILTIPLLDDYMKFTDLRGSLFLLRLISVVLSLASSITITFVRYFKEEGLHWLTALVATAISLCSVAILAFIPESSFMFFLFSMVAGVILRTVFVTTLHSDYSIISGILLGISFIIVVLYRPDVPTPVAVRLTGGMVVVILMSFISTYLIERYARLVFAQHRELQRQSLSLAEQARQLTVTIGEAEQANLAKSVFLSNMSHELRTPLNAVLGFTQLMDRDQRIPVDQRKNLAIIRRSGEHLLGLINDVLAISKIEAGHLNLAEHPFDLRLMLKSVHEMVRIRAEPKGLDLDFDLAPTLPQYVHGDEGKLRQVLLNLLGNAVKFTEAGAVRLRARWEDDRAFFTVEDTGVGISQEEIGKLFAAFMQTESGRKAKEGTGLGLVISQRIVNLMGGDISARSQLDKGTTFEFDVTLPLSGEVQPAVNLSRVVGFVQPDTPSAPPPRILVVDDTSESRTLLAKLLSSVGFDVREAADGAQAVEVWKQWRPRMVFMDVRMPVMDGKQAAQRIREIEAEVSPDQHTSIVALTASVFDHEREEILSYGLDDFVTKPFYEEELFSRIARYLGLQLLREERPPESHFDKGAGALTADRVAALPPEQIKTLQTALDRGDPDAAMVAVEQIRTRDAELASAMEKAIQNYDFDELLVVIDDVERST